MTEALNDAVDNAVFDSSGSVFADLNLPSSEEDMLKIEISRAIAGTIRRRKLTQSEAAALLSIDQGKISMILRGRLKGFSVSRLINFLVLLGRNVDIRISGTTSDKPGRVKVSQAA